MNVFELEAKIGLDDSEYNSKLGKAGSAMGSMGKKITSGLKTVAKVGVAAVSAGAAALTALGKASIQQYAEYEQLSGGVQKIFDEMDNTQIFRDAENAWKDLNMSANDYLSTIVDVGANFASTMGDAKGYETARRGFLAISDYASGTGKNVDELAQKFTMITRSASSYQSIADQFSGILPATSKDFMEQAKAAGFLSDGYKELTQVPIAEYQEAVALMLEKGVAALNLTGNTARETETTISGSFFAMRSAWYNLTTGFADGSQDIDQLLDNFIFSVENVGKNVIPVIKDMLPRIVDGIGYLIDELGPEVGEIIEDLLPHLIRGASSLVAKLVVKLPEILKTLAVSMKEALVKELEEQGFEEAAQTVEDAFNFILENKDGIISALEGIGAAVAIAFAVGGIMNFISAIGMIFSPLGLLAATVATVAAAVIENWDRIVWSWNTLMEQFEILGQGFSEICEDIKQWFAEVGQSISDEVNSIGESWNKFVQGISDMREGAIQIWNDMTTALGEGWATFTTGLSTAWSDFTTSITSSDLWSSFTQSMSDLYESAKQTWDDICSTVSGAVEDLKGLMNFEWSLPHIKMPHFSISGGFSLDPPSVPHINVEWYRKAMNNAMILNGATIFGSMNGQLLGGGEAGKEVVSGADTLMDMIKTAVREVIKSGSGIQIVQNIQTVPQTPVELAAATQSYFEQARWAI